MTQAISKPTEELYSWVSDAFDHFNQKLFQGTLPSCIITMQREKKVMGYFSADRWKHAKGASTHEIALNPAYFASSNVIEVLQTLVHEMCHMWQEVYGQHKSARTYHNKEWSNKMESIGLMPSSTGRPGGKKTGQSMSDYPINDGLFIAACKTFAKSHSDLLWVDKIQAISPSCQPREPNWIDDEIKNDETLNEVLATNIIELVPGILSTEEIVEIKQKKQKTRYSCPSCESNVWGKPSLNISCEDCNVKFEEN